MKVYSNVGNLDLRGGLKLQNDEFENALVYQIFKDPISYKSSLSYDLGQFCSYNNKLYKSKESDNLGNLPTDTMFWEEFTSGGDNTSGVVLGDGTKKTVYIYINDGTENFPAIRWNNSIKAWEYSNDGVGYVAIGSGGGGGSSQEDLEFNNSSLITNKLTVNGTAGVKAVVDNNGFQVIPTQIRYLTETTEVDLTGFDVIGTWKLKF